MKAENNPFRSAAIAKLRYRLGDAERRQIVAALRAHGWRGCIRGPEGTGKTTLLEDLEATVQSEGATVRWIRLHLDSTADERRAAECQLAEMTPTECCFLDGGEILGWLKWRRVIRHLKKRHFGLIATVHRPCPLPIIHQAATDSGQALAFVSQLAGESWTADLEIVARAAFEKHRGNVREVFRACYWHCALAET